MGIVIEIIMVYFIWLFFSYLSGDFDGNIDCFDCLDSDIND